MSSLNQRKTQTAYLATRILDTPFWSLFNLLPFIIYKNLHATPFEIGLIITLKPLVSILSSYWSTQFQRLPNGQLKSLAYGRLLAYLPFFLFPFFHSVWFLIFCIGTYLFLQVGMVPSWLEILKQNLPPSQRDKIFSFAQAFGYLGGGLLPFLLGWILDEWTDAWKWLFPFAALVGMTAYLWQRKIIFESLVNSEEEPCHPLVHPWKTSWNLLRQDPRFAHFQVGFMLIGSGLMIIQPTLPIFFVDSLQLSFVEMGAAITLCKGIGFACSSPFWGKWMHKVDIFHFGALIAATAAIFPLLLFASTFQMIWLYAAYIVYGVMQSGNELSWNMSGPIFSRNKDSSPYSTVNLIAVGIRGMFIPTLGAFLLEQYGAVYVMLISGLFFFLASIRMSLYAKQDQPLENPLS